MLKKSVFFVFLYIVTQRETFGSLWKLYLLFKQQKKKGECYLTCIPHKINNKHCRYSHIISIIKYITISVTSKKTLQQYSIIHNYSMLNVNNTRNLFPSREDALAKQATLASRAC